MDGKKEGGGAEQREGTGDQAGDGTGGVARSQASVARITRPVAQSPRVERAAETPPLPFLPSSPLPSLLSLSSPLSLLLPSSPLLPFPSPLPLGPRGRFQEEVTANRATPSHAEQGSGARPWVRVRAPPRALQGTGWV